MDALKKFLELTEKALAVLTKISFLMGGAILLVYCGRYGGFPDGLSLSDTLRIFLVVTVFSMGTLVVYFFMMCLGFTVWHQLFILWRIQKVRQVFYSLRAWKRKGLRKATVLRHGRSEFFRNYKRHRVIRYQLRFPAFTPGLYVVSAMTVIGMLIFIPLGNVGLYLKFIISSLMLGLTFITVHFNLQIDAQMHLVVPDIETKLKKKSESRYINILYPALIIICVTFLLGLFDTTANRTMEILGIRHEHATVYVQTPWSDILQKHGVKRSPDDSVPGHVRFNDMTVALSSFGNSVTLSVGNERSSSVLRIPANAVVMDTMKDQNAERQAGQ
ncbi:hypothetical protein N4G40_09080 [Pantoea eucrina]|uniref:Uncharacterized protein n=1 Tax=Pantoea eucrina TaxID=472693 RepID=A0ABU5LER2_9GAMM|nr:hypothetical protein [Pantoea eucrina]MDZ7278424.1 hypothetical protein [Pantoea eucrina]